MSETPGVYNIGGDSEALLRTPLEKPQASAHRVPRPQKTSLESQIESLPPDVRSVAESLALRDLESARRYVAQYLAGRGPGRG